MLWLKSLVLFLSLVSAKAGPAVRTKFYKLEHFSVCENDTELMISTKDLSISFLRDVLSFHGSFEVVEDIKDHVQLEIFLFKCEGVDFHCELFTNNTYSDLCEELQIQASYGKILGQVKPAFLCPLKAGVYDMTEVSTKLDMINNLPIAGFLWNVIIAGYRTYEESDEEEKEMVACWSTYVRVFSGAKRPSG